VRLEDLDNPGLWLAWNAAREDTRWPIGPSTSVSPRKMPSTYSRLPARMTTPTSVTNQTACRERVSLIDAASGSFGPAGAAPCRHGCCRKLQKRRKQHVRRQREGRGNSRASLPEASDGSGRVWTARAGAQILIVPAYHQVGGRTDSTWRRRCRTREGALIIWKMTLRRIEDVPDVVKIDGRRFRRAAHLSSEAVDEF
jgi:hypothetical protein